MSVFKVFGILVIGLFLMSGCKASKSVSSEKQGPKSQYLIYASPLEANSIWSAVRVPDSLLEKGANGLIRVNMYEGFTRLKFECEGVEVLSLKMRERKDGSFITRKSRVSGAFPLAYYLDGSKLVIPSDFEEKPRIEVRNETTAIVLLFCPMIGANGWNSHVMVKM